MAIQSSFYSGTALNSRTFPSTKHIATKANVAVWKKQIADDTWVQAAINEYQLINNSCVFNSVLDTTVYSDIEVRVVDEPNELLNSPSNINIVAGAVDNINIVADFIKNGDSKDLSKIKSVDTLADLKALTSTPPTVWVSGYHTKSDGAFGSNIFEWDATSTEDDNGGTIIKLDNVDTGRYKLKFNGAVNVKWFGVEDDRLFGLSSVKPLIGQDLTAHYAWGSIVEIPNSNKWVMVYRKGLHHGTQNGTELRTAISYDFGKTWENDTLVYSNLDSDSRPDRIALLANGRIGLFLNRASESTTHFNPLFVYSDDEGTTWSNNEVVVNDPYTFSAVGGIISYPTSQGGNDITGFISFGYLSANGLDALTTTDNGNTWTIVEEVAQPISGDSSISENVQVRLGVEDKWLMFARSRGESTDDVIVYKTTNLLDWGTPQSANIENLSTPPAAYYDNNTDKVWYLRTARDGKEYNNLGNHILGVCENATTLWNNNGVFTENYKVITAVPNWFTGYIYTFKSILGNFATFTAGESNSNNNDYSAIHLIGNFETSSKDIVNFTDLITKRQKNVKSIEIVSDTNNTDEYTLKMFNNAKTANILQNPYTFSRDGGGSTYNLAYNSGEVFYHYADSVTIKSDKDIIFDVDSAYNVKFNDYNVLFCGLDTKIDNLSAGVHLSVGGSTLPAIRSKAVGTSNSRKHYVFHHTVDASNDSEVGNISTTDSSTSYNTASDETLKDFIGEYPSEKAIDIIKADPVREFTWKHNNEQAVGWGAQTSYKVSKDLATKGGWFKDGVEVDKDTEGANYVIWSVDQSKRTPYLWSAVTNLIKRVEELETLLKNK